MERLQATSARLALYKIIVLPYGISGCKCDKNAISQVINCGEI